MASVFSKIAKGEIPSYKVAETDDFLAILDAFPIVKGHTLVFAKEEIDKFYEIPKNKYAELQKFAYDVAKAVEKAVPCKRVGMAVIGLEVPHAHIHLIPLNSEKDMNFSNKIELSDTEFKEIAEKIKNYL